MAFLTAPRFWENPGQPPIELAGFKSWTFSRRKLRLEKPENRMPRHLKLRAANDRFWPPELATVSDGKMCLNANAKIAPYRGANELEVQRQIGHNLVGFRDRIQKGGRFLRITHGSPFKFDFPQRPGRSFFTRTQLSGPPQRSAD